MSPSGLSDKTKKQDCLLKRLQLFFIFLLKLKMNKLKFIDALRGLAIIGVIIVHTGQHGNTKLPWYISKFVEEGARGVQLFFLASAFTLFLSFNNRVNKEKNATRNFFIRRFFRIAPMYYLGIVYYFFQNNFGTDFQLGGKTLSSIPLIISNITFIHGVSPYYINTLVPGGWSISVEFMFYALVPLLFACVKNLNQSLVFFITTTVLTSIIKFYFLKYPLIEDSPLWADFLFLNIINQLPVFALGLMFYFIVIKNENLSNISKSSLLALSVLVFCHLCMPYMNIISNHIFFSIGFLILAYALSKNGFIILNNAIIRYIGTISFSMYLVHIAVLYWLDYFNFTDYFESGSKNFLVRSLITIGLSILVSTIFYRLIEVPGQKLGKKMIEKLN